MTASCEVGQASVRKVGVSAGVILSQLTRKENASLKATSYASRMANNPTRSFAEPSSPLQNARYLAQALQPGIEKAWQSKNDSHNDSGTSSRCISSTIAMSAQ